MTDTRTPARTGAPVPVAAAGDPLHSLLERIAQHDRAAFRCLYAFLAVRIWQDALRRLPRPGDARAVTRSTFVEVWHMAGHQLARPRLDTRGWITTITARHAYDRRGGPGVPSPLRLDHDRHTHHELALLLGTGRATVRVGLAGYARVEALDPYPGPGPWLSTVVSCGPVPG